MAIFTGDHNNGLDLTGTNTIAHAGLVTGMPGPSDPTPGVGPGSPGVYMALAGALYNFGSIDGGLGGLGAASGGAGGDGVLLHGGGKLYNYYEIVGGVGGNGGTGSAGAGGDGVYAAAGSVATITNTYLIAGGDAGSLGATAAHGGNGVVFDTGVLQNLSGTISGGTGFQTAGGDGVRFNHGTLNGSHGFIFGGDVGSAIPDMPANRRSYGYSGGAGVSMLQMPSGAITGSNTIVGGTGGVGPTGNNGNQGSVLENNGAGGYGGGGGSGGSGGIGVYLSSGAVVTISGGEISGGTGGSGGAGGDGGAGAYEGGRGGNGGAGGPGGTGGTGVWIGSSGTITITSSEVIHGGTGGIGSLLGGQGGAGTRGGPNGQHGGGGPGGYGGVGVNIGSGSTVSNMGTIVGGMGGPSGNAGSGVVTNGTLDNGGLIRAAGADGVVVSGGLLLNTHTGTITGSTGVDIQGAATVINSGMITGEGDSHSGVIAHGAATVINTGTITGGRYGPGAEIDLGLPGSSPPSTLINDGTISGAVYIESTNSRLIIDPGAVFIGTVLGADPPGLPAGLGTTTALELGQYSPTSSSDGTIAGLGEQFRYFDQLTIDSGTTWNLTGTTTVASYTAVTNDGTLKENASDQLTLNGSVTNNGTIEDPGGTLTLNGPVTNNGAIEVTGGSLTTAGSIGGTGIIEVDPTTVTLNGAVGSGQTVDLVGAGDVLRLGDPTAFDGTISGFAVGDTIDLVGVTVEDISFNPTDRHLLIDTGGTPVLLHLTGTYAGETFHYDSSGDITIACYRRGTLILTSCGEVAVEDLQIGDWVVTHTGEAEPIKWIGRRRYDARFIAGKPHVLPIRIQANALADSLPMRDLWVSPQHALSLEGVLIPASELVNGLSITQEPVQEELEYIHIELASHALIRAEGVAAETFVDDNSRQLFENADEYVQLYPDEERTAAQFCSERLSGTYEVEMIRWRLADRAQELWSSRSSRAA